jgi:hypothetical protein
MIHREFGEAGPRQAERQGVMGRPRFSPSAAVYPADAAPRAELEKLIGLSGAALELRVACLAWNCTP